MPQEVEYLNARVRGMMADLLSDGQISTAVDAAHIGDWAEALRNTAYPIPGGRLDRSAIPDLFPVIDRSIYQRTHRLSRIPAGRLGRAVFLLLAEKDLENLLPIFTCVLKHMPVAFAMETVLAGGILSPGQLEELARSADAKEIADRLTTWGFAMQRPVREAVTEASGSGLSRLRLALSRRYMTAIVNEAGELPYGVVGRYAADRIDVFNLMSSVMWRALPSDRDPMDAFIDKGASLTRRQFRCILSAGEDEDAAGCLKPGWLKKALIRAGTVRDITGRISSIREVLEQEMHKKYTRPMAIDPLGLELVLAFILLLFREGRLLKLALTRILSGLSPDRFAEVTGDV